MKKIVHIGLSVIAVVLLAIVTMKPSIVDSAVLLEKKHPGYGDWIMNASNEYVDEDAEPYLLTFVDKDGFGAVKPDDISFYMKYNRSLHPDMNRAVLRFNEGTGIEIGDYSAQYGALDETERVADGETIDLSVPLISQIEDLTILEREYDDRGNLIYQFRRDGEGKGVADLNGVCGFIREYDKSGNVFRRNNDNLISELYLGDDGMPVNCKNGYAEVHREYDENILTSEAYFDLEGNPANRTDFGCASIKYDYNDADSYLTYCYDASGQLLKMGSSYFHEFLQSLKGKNFIISIMDEGTDALTNIIIDDLHSIGVKTDLKGKHRYSYYAIALGNEVTEKISLERISYNETIDGKKIDVISSGHGAGSLSSIMIDGVEYSQNVRGMNFVVLDEDEVLESVSFDTYAPQMKMTKVEISEK